MMHVQDLFTVYILIFWLVLNIGYGCYHKIRIAMATLVHPRNVVEMKMNKDSHSKSYPIGKIFCLSAVGILAGDVMRAIDPYFIALYNLSPYCLKLAFPPPL